MWYVVEVSCSGAIVLPFENYEDAVNRFDFAVSSHNEDALNDGVFFVSDDLTVYITQ